MKDLDGRPDIEMGMTQIYHDLTAFLEQAEKVKSLRNP